MAFHWSLAARVSLLMLLRRAGVGWSSPAPLPSLKQLSASVPVVKSEVAYTNLDAILSRLAAARGAAGLDRPGTARDRGSRRSRVGVRPSCT